MYQGKRKKRESFFLISQLKSKRATWAEREKSRRKIRRKKNGKKEKKERENKK